MQEISPVLAARDIDVSIAFYRDVLGFPEGDVLRMPNGQPVHGMVRWGAVMIMFSPDGMGAPVGENRGAGVTFYLHVNGDVDAYYQEVVGKGAKVVEEIKTQDWGDRTFTVADPDGYHLAFYQTVRTVTMEDMQKALAQG